VHVWRIHAISSFEWLEPLRSILSSGEIYRAGRFRFDEDQMRFVITHGCLRLLLGKYIHISPDQINFQNGNFGKPHLVNCELEFNISHSGDYSLIAFAVDRIVGVDVELHRANLEIEKVAKRFFSKREITTLMNLSHEEQSNAFFSIWTRKEAYIKAHGLGLALPLDSFDVSLEPHASNALIATRPDKSEADRWTIRSLDMGDEYSGAVAVDGRELNIEFFDLQIDRTSTFR